jgi:hypothetical protein
MWKSPRGCWIGETWNYKLKHALYLRLGLEINLGCRRLFLLLWVAQSIRITLGANSNKYEQGNFREKREEKQIEWRSTQLNTAICLSRFGSKEPSHVEEATKAGSICNTQSSPWTRGTYSINCPHGPTRSPRTNKSLLSGLCPHSCTPEKTFQSVTHPKLLQAKHA